MRARRTRHDRGRPIAITGMAGRFPGAADVHALWALLARGGSAIGPVPASRWDVRALDAHGRIASVGGFLDDLELFDADAFGLSARVAVELDPQHRLLLEVSARALEDAGVPRAALAGSRTGVYVAAGASEFPLLRAQRGAALSPEGVAGGALDPPAQLLARHYALAGPALTLGAGAAASLEALHLARRALDAGEIEAALVAGVQVLLVPEPSVALARAGRLSPSGCCRAFGAGADGYVRGEGAVCLYLEPHTRAVRAARRARVHLLRTALARDVAVDGHAALLRRAHAALPGGALAYVEAHGEGSPLADAREARAIASALADARAPTLAALPIGSLKPNLGHLGAAAGLAGVVKAACVLAARRVPPALYADPPIPQLAEPGAPLCVAHAGLALPATGALLAGVSAHDGGTLAHAVLQRAEPPAPIAVVASGPWLVPISARDDDTLARYAQRLAAAVAETEATLPAVAGTLAHRRDHGAVRAAIVASDNAELAARLAELARPRSEAPVAARRDGVVGRAVPVGRVAFVLSGRALGWGECGARLLAASPCFAAALARACAALRPHVDADLLPRIADGGAERAPAPLRPPIAWALSCALAALYRELGIAPDLVVGHGDGEVAAASVAGVLGDEDAARVVVARARRPLAPAALTVALGLQEARALVADRAGALALVSHDGPRACTLAGALSAIEAVERALDGAGVFCRRIESEHVAHLSHDAYDLRGVLAGVVPRPSPVAFASTRTGGLCDGATLDLDYWAGDARAPMRFADAVRAALAAGVTHLVELSPRPTLFGVLSQLAAERDPPPRVLAALRPDEDPLRGLTRALAQAYVSGLAPLALLPRDALVSLPGPPLRPRRHWVAPRTQRAADLAPDVRLAPSPLEAGAWEGTRALDDASPAFLRDLRVRGRRVLPTGALLACALSAARARFALPSALHDLQLGAPLSLADAPRTLGVALRDDGHEGGSLRISSRASGEAAWRAHLEARVERAQGGDAPRFPDDLSRRSAWDAPTFYAALRSRGHEYGPALRGVARVHVAAPRALAALQLPPQCLAGLGAEALHPALLSAALSVALALCDDGEALAPVAVARARPLASEAGAMTSGWVYVMRRGPCRFDVTVYDAAHVARLQLDDLQLRAHALPAPALRHPERLLRLRFHRAAPTAPPAEGGRWLVCGERDDGAEQIAAALRALGHEVERAPALTTSAAWQEALRRTGAPLSGVAFLAPRLASHARHCATLCALAGLVTACSRLRAPPQLAIVTTFAQGVCEHDAVIPEGGLYWGFARVLRREHAELSARVVDCGSDAASIAACATELVGRDGEDQVALRGDRRYVGRLLRGEPLAGPRPLAPWQLPPQPFALRLGPHRALVARPCPRRAPEPGEVEVAVSAAAVRSSAPTEHDEPGSDDLPLGDACAGVITAVGSGTSGLRLGDRVIACADGALATHVTCTAQHVRKVPAVLSDAQAAALPLPLLTAWHGLHGLARMTRGERLLVHAEPGGVGLAAVAVARALGAEVLATATSDAARARLQALGVSRVFDPRTPGFADQVRAATGERGVDVVLGASSGDALRVGLALLVEDGRYLALPPRDAQHSRHLPLALLRRGVSVSLLDLAGMRAQRPDRFARLLATVWNEVAAGHLPPLPLRPCRFADAAEALRGERRTEHVEALVFTEPDSVRGVVPTPRVAGRFRGDATYLVSGGLGALGLALVTFLAERGARAFLLLGRSSPSSATRGRLAALRRTGVTVETAAVDVADRPALERALASARRSLPPVRGVFHAAGLRDDATIVALAPAQLARVLAPKVEGARNLDALTGADPLDLFVLFSSAAALLGTAGQAAYAAANGYLDALAEARRRRGLPALSMQWGPFEALGLAAADPHRAARLGERGMGSLTPDEGFQALLAALDADVPVVGYVPLALTRWFHAHPEAVAQPSWESLREAAASAAQES